ncbi:MAG TPA: outer membrane beta-barrel protein [Microvirga sp.]|nr:outer membrane beta-barrel protein [Microvirga sp.]
MAAAMLLSGAAQGADLPVRAAPPPLPVLAAAPAWDGFYAGTGIGYMWTRAATRAGGRTRAYDLDGATSVTFAGRDWQFGRVVAGLEGEIGFHETKGRLGTAATLGVQGDHLWSGGVRGRLGYAFGTVLPFVTLGVAGTEYNQHSLVVNQDSDVARHLGWSAGAGVEVAWTRGFATRVEYQYADYGRESYRHDGRSHAVDIASHAVKASLVVREVPGMAAGAPTPGRGGAYAGVLAGYGLGDAAFARPRGGRTGIDLDGAEIGLFSGYEIAFGSWFVGYDGHVLASGIDGRGAGPAGPMAVDLLWSGAARARAGTSFGAVSPYLAGGFSLAQLNLTSRSTGQQDAEMAYGGTAGIGLDYAITDRWFARAEYAYTRYARVEPRVDAAVNRLDLDRHDLRIGIGYRLGP